MNVFSIYVKDTPPVQKLPDKCDTKRARARALALVSYV